MFAKPEWFHSSSQSVLPGPRNNRGWAFYAICLAGVMLPALLLIARQQIFPEAAIWVAVSSLAFWLEIHGLKRNLKEREARRNMYYIDERGQSPVCTERYELETRDTG
jgi:hypothetical protein